MGDGIPGSNQGKAATRGLLCLSVTEAANKAKQAWLTAQAAARQADGRFGVMPDDVKQGLKDARTRLASAQDDLTVAQSHENAFTKVFDTRASDLPNLADGLADDSILLKALDVPGGQRARQRRQHLG